MGESQAANASTRKHWQGRSKARWRSVAGEALRYERPGQTEKFSLAAFSHLVRRGILFSAPPVVFLPAGSAF
jgi:hypothetical protein